MDRIILFCRAGFEPEAGREITDVAAREGCYGYFEPAAQCGYLFFNLADGTSGASFLHRVCLTELVFVRDWFEVITDCPLPKTDRVGAVLECLRSLDHMPRAGRVEVRVPDESDMPDLVTFARKWVSPLSWALRDTGLLAQEADDSFRLEIFLTSFENAVIGVSHADNRARFVGGKPRLRLPTSAPSRSALKLEEAWKVFIPESLWLDYLGDGKKAVDLGASPGGWTWQLVRQGMLVSAVDNGPMDEALMASGMVDHIKADGYGWRPHRAVDWMVCDIADKPRRTAALVVDWIGQRRCRFAVFNLKLPMKQRYDEWLTCRERILSGLEAAEVDVRLRAKHLYHDREEITCFIERFS